MKSENSYWKYELFTGSCFTVWVEDSLRVGYAGGLCLSPGQMFCSHCDHCTKRRRTPLQKEQEHLREQFYPVSLVTEQQDQKAPQKAAWDSSSTFYKVFCLALLVPEHSPADEHHSPARPGKSEPGKAQNTPGETDEMTPNYCKGFSLD